MDKKANEQKNEAAEPMRWQRADLRTQKATKPLSANG